MNEPLLTHTHQVDAWSRCPSCKAAGRLFNEAFGQRTYGRRLREKADAAERIAKMLDKRAQDLLPGRVVASPRGGETA